MRPILALQLDDDPNDPAPETPGEEKKSYVSALNCAYSQVSLLLCDRF